MSYRYPYLLKNVQAKAIGSPKKRTETASPPDCELIKKVPNKCWQKVDSDKKDKKTLFTPLSNLYGLPQPKVQKSVKTIKDEMNTSRDSSDSKQKLSNLSFLKPQIKQILCSKHSLKNLVFQAKFKTKDDKYLCNICAVESAYQMTPMTYIKKNILIQPIQQKQINWDLESILSEDKIQIAGAIDVQNKKMELQQFLNTLEGSYKEAEIKQEQITKLQQTSNIVNYNTSQLDDLAKELSHLIVSNLKDQFNWMEGNDHENASLKNTLCQTLTQIDTFINDIQCIRSDIVLNVKNILQTMEFQPFQLIIQKYTQKLQFYFQQLQSKFQFLETNFGIINITPIKLKLLQNSHFKQGVKNFVECALNEDYSSLNNLGQKKQQEVYISFEDKEVFKENQSPPTNKFVELLNKINSQQNLKNNFLTSIMTDRTSKDKNSNLLFSPHFNDKDY